MTTAYKVWLHDRKETAKARGGKPLPFVPSAEGDLKWTGRHKVEGRERGEIFNPRTGEFIKGCLTAALFAKELGVATGALYGRLEALGIMHRAVDSKDVPTLTKARPLVEGLDWEEERDSKIDEKWSDWLQTNPGGLCKVSWEEALAAGRTAHSKPNEYLPATRPITFHRHRLTPWAVDESYGITVKDLDLITPDGQAFVRARLGSASGVGKANPTGNLADEIESVFDTTPWLPHGTIARKLGCSRKTVSVHFKRLTLTKLKRVA